jgi:hypothetical protein
MTPTGIVCTVLAIAVSIYLYVEHQAHVYALLPYVFLAACPLMHVFMHRGHHHGHARGQGSADGSDEPHTRQGR